VQSHALAQIGETDAVAIAGDFFQNRETAADRLHAAALTFIGVATDGAKRRCLDARPRGLAWHGPLFHSRLH
jgi:hypothetical protein